MEIFRDIKEQCETQCRKGCVVREWLPYNCPKVLETPPQSPDLNVIEHLWQELKYRVKKRTISNKQQLNHAIEEEWSKISPELSKKLVLSMNNRIIAVKNSKGWSTKY
ncbi:DDE superfamily endonuclease [Popillia japonica]|uniref:DDE superfamily endonuclease n=1 Tax=Popillia japonica TaxID=7064 RepID=A0AAW1KJH6_POPJA